MKKPPRQKRGKSRQDYGTPHEFLQAVEDRFGEIVIDLAATEENAVTSRFLTSKEDSLSILWRQLLEPSDIGWLNPPFADIDPWASHCAIESCFLRGGARILFLVPASIGSDWFRSHVNRKAFVHALSPRLTFVGCKDPYPKDCILAEYGAGAGFDVWRWK